MSGKRITGKAIFGATMPFRAIIIGGIAFFLTAWRFDILRAWIYFGTVFFGAVVGLIIMLVCIPGLAHERSRAKEGTKRWDRLIVLSYFILRLICMPVLVALDTVRFGWSTLPFWFVYIGVGLYIFSTSVTMWAMLVNPFFEGTVRIQEDRGHKVITKVHTNSSGIRDT